MAVDLPSSQSRDAAVGRPGVVLVADAMAGRPGGRLAGPEHAVLHGPRRQGLQPVSRRTIEVLLVEATVAFVIVRPHEVYPRLSHREGLTKPDLVLGEGPMDANPDRPALARRIGARVLDLAGGGLLLVAD